MLSCVRQNILSVEHVKLAQQQLNWSRLYGSAPALAIANLAVNSDQPVVVITEDSASTTNLLQELKFYLTDLEKTPVMTFPDWEILPYDLLSPYQDIISQRLRTLYTLTGFKRGIVVVMITTLLHRLLPRDYLLANSAALTVGETINPTAFKQQLARQGYLFVSQITAPGEVAVRGSLLDIFPMGAQQPLRIDLFDNQIDSIKIFDVDTQRSHTKVNTIQILPAREVTLLEEDIARFQTNWCQIFDSNPYQHSIYRDVSQGLAPAGIEYYLSLFYQRTHTLFDYINKPATVVINEGVTACIGVFWEEVAARYEEIFHELERPILPPKKIFLNEVQLNTLLKRFTQVHINNLTTATELETIAYNSEIPPSFFVNTRAAARAEKPLLLINRFLTEFNGRVLIAAESLGRRETIIELFKPYTGPDIVADWQSFLQSNMQFGITVMPIQRGLLIHEPNIAVIAEAQLFGARANQSSMRHAKKQDVDAIVRNLTELSIGAPVVHEDHGVGRYLGLETLETDGVLGDFIHLEYADGDKLYVPVMSLNLISRYTGIDVDQAPLHKLGGIQWERVKRKAAEQIHDVAAELLELNARRAISQVPRYHIEKEPYSAFVQGFPFEETPGQKAAIDAIITDLNQSKPMNRLVCGDSGFGKTEVAMRAAFITIQNGKQVALLVPTTLLAQQHYQNFVDRFANWPAKLALLSRFRSKQAQRATLTALAAGEIDMVIGTHKLLQSDISFYNLGLIIIDEEHRFGVRQKEKLTAISSETNILTLTATPIPRTLNMALSNLRELSIIQTPPSNRLAVKTFVNEYDRNLLKEVIQRELKRGGQVFYLHNHIKTISKTANEISTLLPQARVQFAHGQLREKVLEAIMLDFYHRRFNVLVCTTIIETGIDIPTANTIIIEHADTFGLAQLYQLRGRVGRSHHRAYAYLITPPRSAMTANAIKRLEAITALEDLGTGFTLATHDLEIRGAGELLGKGQSGHIQEIGFSLYMKLLDQTVHAMKQGQQPTLDRPLDHGTEINLHAAALIPGDFIADVHMRLIMYKRIASAESIAALNELKEEMIDRFGLLPEPVNNLFAINQLKQLAKPLSIRKIDLGLNGGRIFFEPNAQLNHDRLMDLIQSQADVYKLAGQDTIKIVKELADIKTRIQLLSFLFNELTLNNAAN